MTYLLIHMLVEILLIRFSIEDVHSNEAIHNYIDVYLPIIKRYFK